VHRPPKWELEQVAESLMGRSPRRYPERLLSKIRHRDGARLGLEAILDRLIRPHQPRDQTSSAVKCSF
jgi:hypothetical protein